MLVKEYAEMCKVHRNTVRNWCRKGLIPCSWVRVGKRICITSVNDKAVMPMIRPGPRPVVLNKNLLFQGEQIEGQLDFESLKELEA